MSARDDLAQAVTATGLVNVSPNYRQTIRTGQGFVKWSGRRQADNGFGWIDTWQVWIALDGDVAKAETWLATNLQTLIDAAHTEVVVTDAVPAELVIGTNSVNGLIIEGARASGT